MPCGIAKLRPKFWTNTDTRSNSQNESYQKPIQVEKTVKVWELGCTIPWKCAEKIETVTEFVTSYRPVNVTSTECCPGWHDEECKTRKVALP